LLGLLFISTPILFRKNYFPVPRATKQAVCFIARFSLFPYFSWRSTSQIAPFASLPPGFGLWDEHLSFVALFYLTWLDLHPSETNLFNSLQKLFRD